MSMDMRISGAGNIPSGNYEKVSISGSGRLGEQVRCVAFSVSGASKGETIECAERFKVSGGAKFLGDIKAKTVRVSGSLSCGGELVATEEIACFGSVQCEKTIKCEKLTVSGSLSAMGDVEAESVETSGTFNCTGLLNAEKIKITADRAMQIGSIGGSKISIGRKRFSLFLKRGVTVENAIEGDEITLEYVTCPCVTGRIVNIGKGCKIGHVQFSEKMETSPKAKVKTREKI